MFAAKSSSGEDSSASFHNSGSDSGKEFQNHLAREGQQSAEPHLNSISSKSVDSTSAAESHSSQSAQKSVENDVIRQIVQRMTLRSSGDQSRMTIQLKPEFLGQLKLDISTENHHVVVKMTAESAVVKEMIEHNIGVLRTELQQHGLNIDKFDVYVGQDNESWKQRQQDAASRQGRRGNMRSFNDLDALEEDTDRPLASTTSAGADTGKSRSGEIDFFA
jgi:flagellar hook-length control protein FliK